MNPYAFLRAFHEHNDKSEDCCIFTAELFNLVCKAMPDESRIIQRGTEKWRWAMVTDPQDAWSIISAYIPEVGYAPNVVQPSSDDFDFTVGMSYLVQGWRNLFGGKVVKSSRGHTWMWLPIDASVGLRLHNSRQHGKRIEVATWQDIVAKYDEIGIVEL